MTNNCGARECPGTRSIYQHIYYLKNSSKIKANVSRWREENPDKVREIVQRQTASGYYRRPEVRARIKTWEENNRQLLLANQRKYKIANRSLYASYEAKRRASKLQATPAWLTEDHWSLIKSVYEEAARLTLETGIAHEVDHIVPLQGKTVCGLHVPWNLRVITKEENRRKSGNFPQEK